MKVFEFDQPATFIMSMTELLLFLAVKVAADLVECPLNVPGVPKKTQRVSQTVTLHSMHQNCSMMAHFKGAEITYRVVQTI